MGLFCKHNWEIIDKEVLPAPSEGQNWKKIKGVSEEFFQRKYVCILQCKKCGKLNKTIED